MKLKPLKIGKYTIKTPILLAPMVEVTDLPYRRLCMKYGAGLTFTEMLYLDAINHENKKTKYLMDSKGIIKPKAIQITGNNIKELKKALPHLKKYDIIDLNCGCPSTRIVGSKAGSFLLKNPNKISKMIKILKKEGLTVTVKIRLGYDKNNVIKIAKIIEKAGADAITLHARLSTQSYNTPADWSWIKKVKESIKIPVIGNGDITNGKSVEEMLKIADGAMIGRAAIGNPQIFDNIIHYLNTGEEKETTKEEKIKAFKEYLNLESKSDYIELQRIKYLTSKFLSGFENSSKLRNKLMKLKTIEEIIEFSKVIII